MTRPDLEALAEELSRNFDYFGDAGAAVRRIAAHERARIVADIRARAGRAAKMDRHGTEHLLRDLADELEAELADELEADK